MHGLGRLLEVYPRPRHYPEDTEAIAKIWQREIGDLDVEVWRAGVSGYCKGSGRYFPTPGEIRSVGQGVAHPSVVAAGLAGAYAEWEVAWGEAPLGKPIPCPVCGAIDGWSMSPPTTRRIVYHAAEQHAAAGVPFTGLAAERLGGTVVVPEAAA
jgi:hypothetical protein